MLRYRELSFMLTAVYGPQEDSAKINFLRELAYIRNLNEYPWIIIGDFNIIREMSDTTGYNCNLGIMMEFNNFIADTNLIEALLRGKKYTWTSKRPVPTFSRLDRALLSCHWNSVGASFELTDLSATASDHTPSYPDNKAAPKSSEKKIPL